jgi:peptidoglycan/xylan/chitin deacetylase (PgdA/CDA1 family)
MRIPPTFTLLRLALLSGSAALAADTPLPNPGFEEGGALWSISGSAQLAPEAARSGKQGLRVGSAAYNTDGASATSARLPVAPGQEIALAFHVRSQAPCSGAYLWLYDAAGKVVSAPKGCNTACWVSETNDTWTARSLKTVVPPGVASVAVWVHASPGVIGRADYDDFVLTGIAAGAAATPPPPPRKAAAFKPRVDPASLPPRAKPAIIVIKLDDVKQVRGDVHAAWKRVDEVFEARGIKASYGVICETLEVAEPTYVNWIKTRHAAGRVEFWFHGWNHGPHLVDGKPRNEFAGWPYDGMKALVDRSQKAALDKLGFAFRTFGPTGSGAPGPGLDAVAIQVLHDDPHLKVALYPMPLDDMGKKVASDGKMTILDRVWDVNLESLVGVPDCQRLIDGYAAHPDRPYFVLQGHPSAWGGERFNEFLRILDFLVSQKVVFMTPSECAAAIKK